MTKEKVFIKELADLPVQIGHEVHIGSDILALFRLSDDRVLASSNECPLDKGPLAEGIISGDDVFCPLCDCKVSLVDGQIQGPDEGAIKIYTTQVEEGNVYVVM